MPWSELDPFLRQDNILELRSILSAVAARGRQWAPVHLVPPGSVIELSEEDLTASHDRRAHALAAAAARGRRTGENVVPWDGAAACACASDVSGHLRSQLAQLEDVGFVPVVPAGGPPAAARFERVGLVRASQLTEPLAWTNYAGEQMHGFAGDWRVIDDAGNLRTVTDPDFQSSHEPTGDGRWRRVGTLPGLAGQRGRGGQDQGGQGDRPAGRLGGRGPDRRALAGQGRAVQVELPAKRRRARPARSARPGEHARGREQQHGADDLLIERGRRVRDCTSCP